MKTRNVLKPSSSEQMLVRKDLERQLTVQWAAMGLGVMVDGSAKWSTFESIIINAAV